eukprot:TRINITY_DN6278_c0_g1_i1.p1 TRINITY_DN6278_c0_g1~~TRINITY_DN6278_c0_g1_i1.p1  ORF type:complete len:474 (+),score=142.35 TRINITY_DN6278_c0_g1_i1:44-1465(+)
MRAAAFLGLVACAAAAPAADLVDQLPGFPKSSFKVYSGYLNVPGPVAGYDSLKIHYQFHESQRNPAKDPVSAWHQGGPGGSSLYGAYTEMGYFQLNSSSQYVNSQAWNRVSNMLYLESPAGSNDPIGFSECIRNGAPVACYWNDTSQAVAYAKTLGVFFNEFSEYKSNDLYLVGESYAGQYIPNIAYHIVENNLFSNFKGIAVGNGCWGGSANVVDCNGPNEEQNDVDMFYGKGLVSKKTYEQIYKDCPFPHTASGACRQALNTMDREVGPYNIYDIYDNCPQNGEWLKKVGKSQRWLKSFLRSKMHDTASAKAELNALGGGYDWSCGGMAAMGSYFRRSDVQQALHLNKPNGLQFHYSSTGPASVTLYPHLIGKIRVLIYNGDSDACVPYKGNEEWTTGMVAKGVAHKKSAWHPWYTHNGGIPAGYATTYTPTSGDKDFSFITIRLAGHMVPTFQPVAAFSFYERYLEGTPF